MPVNKFVLLTADQLMVHTNPQPFFEGAFEQEGMAIGPGKIPIRQPDHQAGLQAEAQILHMGFVRTFLRPAARQRDKTR